MAMYNEITVTAELTNTEYMITKNYNLLENKPQINSVELIGNKSLEDLGINPDAEPNVIDTVKVNGSALTPDEEKAVNVTVTTGTANGTVKVNGSDVAVKGLKSAAFTESTAYDAAGSAAEVQNNLDALTVVVNGKVDKVQGKGLSQNDFTNAYKNKLDGIEAGAQVNTVTSVAGKTGAVTLQKSDVGLGNVDNTSDLNKPISTATQTALDGKVDKVTGKGLSQNDFTNALKSKLDGIESGAEVNVQADWNQTDVNADDYIKNKPEIGDAVLAEHLALTTPINNKDPYLFRAFPVRNAFKENLKSIVGGSVVWNQLVDTNTTSVTITSGHKYISKINSVWAVGVSDGTAITVDGSRQDMVMDITQKLGTTIANYIYTLEQNTSGSGVAWFRKYFPNVYYAYSAPTIQSTKASAKKVVGFNAYNNTTGKAKLLGGNLYQITGTYTALSYSTGETITPDSNGKFTPTNNGELTVTGGNATDTCVHLVWDGERDGEYEPYKSTTYDLSGSHLVKRKYAEFDIGEVSYTPNASFAHIFNYNLPNDKRAYDTVSALCLYPQYDSGDLANHDYGYAIAQGKHIIYFKNKDADTVEEFKNLMLGNLFIYKIDTPFTETVTNPTLYGILKLDSNNNLYFDGDSFSDFPNISLIDEYGTEEFVDDREVPIPVGNDTDFTQAISIASLPTADGTYNATLTMSNGIATMSFVSTS